METENRTCNGLCAECDDASKCILADPHLKEQKISSELIYEGRILRVTRDIVKLENGAETVREVVHHNGGACVVPLTDECEVMLVRQFRYPHSCETLEVPAGKLELGEDPMECAKRELEEEVGAKSEQLYSLGNFLPTPAYDKEITYMYLAQGLQFGAQHLDEGEFLDVVKMPLQKAVQMVMENKIPDGKTQIALLKTWMMITQG